MKNSITSTKNTGKSTAISIGGIIKTLVTNVAKKVSNTVSKMVSSLQPKGASRLQPIKGPDGKPLMFAGLVVEDVFGQPKKIQPGFQTKTTSKSDETINISTWLIANKGEPSREGGTKIDLHSQEWEDLSAQNKPLGVSTDWYSYEHTKYMNTYAEDQHTAVGKNIDLNISELGNGYVNDEGRYWIAVGPEVVNPGYNTKYPGEKATLKAEQFEFGTEVDVVLKDSRTNEQVYIQCIVGDIKAHTAPHGVFQTGDAYKHSSSAKEDGSKHRNGSYVEFIGFIDEKGKTTNGDMSKYEVTDIIVYDREWRNPK